MSQWVGVKSLWCKWKTRGSKFPLPAELCCTCSLTNNGFVSIQLRSDWCMHSSNFTNLSLWKHPFKHRWQLNHHSNMNCKNYGHFSVVVVVSFGKDIIRLFGSLAICQILVFSERTQIFDLLMKRCFSHLFSLKCKGSRGSRANCLIIKIPFLCFCLRSSSTAAVKIKIAASVLVVFQSLYIHNSLLRVSWHSWEVRKKYQKLVSVEDCMKEFVNSLAYSACEVQK